MSARVSYSLYGKGREEEEDEFEMDFDEAKDDERVSIVHYLDDDSDEEFTRDERKGTLSSLPIELAPPEKVGTKQKGLLKRSFANNKKEEIIELEEVVNYDDDELDDDLEQYMEVEVQPRGFRGRLRRWMEYVGSSEYLGGVYGSASFSLFFIVLLSIPPFLAVVVPKVSYFWVGQFTMIPLITYIIMSVPVALGAIFAWGLRRFGPLNGYPFGVGAISIFPIIRGWSLVIRLVVYDATFGNPPGFPFKNFLECKRLDIEGTISFRDIWNLITFTKVPKPLKNVPDFRRYAFFDFDHVEVSGAMCNFQMYNGRFNINEFTRVLATGEAEAVLKGCDFPNQLSVEVIRAADLQPHRLKSSIDPYVVVRVRRNVKETKSQTGTCDPMFNETLYFNLDDPSVVMEIAVYDRNTPDGSMSGLIGHWAMTTKYLICDPSYCWVIKEGFQAYYPDTKGKTNQPMGFEGWIPLAAKNWTKMGQKGRVQIRLQWTKVSDQALERDTWEPLRRYTALEQLQQQSAEDQLRFGSWSRFRNWLQHEPFSYDVRRFTVRGVKFYVQDLFLGHKGKVESEIKKVKKLQRKGSTAKRKSSARRRSSVRPRRKTNRQESLPREEAIQLQETAEILVQENGGPNADCVRIAFMEMTKQFRPKHGDEGVTTYELFIGFFIGLISQFRKRGKLGNALAQVAASGALNMSKSVKHFFRGKFELTAVPEMRQNLGEMGKFAREGLQAIAQNVTTNRINKKEFNIIVDASDNDFLEEEIELSGYLDRYAMKAKNNVTNESMLLSTSRRGDFKTRWFFVKKDTIFFRQKEVNNDKYLYNLTYKLPIADIQSAIFSRGRQEIVLNVQIEGYTVRLRKPRNWKKLPKDKVRSLDRWFELLEQHKVPCSEFD